MAEFESEFEQGVVSGDEQMYFHNVLNSHESIFITAAIKYCHTCGNVGTIITGFALGISIAGEQNCPDCGDGEWR